MSDDDIRNQFDDFDFSEEDVWGDVEPKPELFGMTLG